MSVVFNMMGMETNAKHWANPWVYQPSKKCGNRRSQPPLTRSTTRKRMRGSTQATSKSMFFAPGPGAR